MSPDDLRHGTDAGYQQRCPCQRCRLAHRLSERAYYRGHRFRIHGYHVARPSTQAPHMVARFAEAFNVTYTAARQLVDGEVDYRARMLNQPTPSAVDRDRWMHRRGMRP